MVRDRDSYRNAHCQCRKYLSPILEDIIFHSITDTTAIAVLTNVQSALAGKNPKRFRGYSGQEFVDSVGVRRATSKTITGIINHTLILSKSFLLMILNGILVMAPRR